MCRCNRVRQEEKRQAFGPVKPIYDPASVSRYELVHLIGHLRLHWKFGRSVTVDIVASYYNDWTMVVEKRTELQLSNCTNCAAWTR